MKKHLRFWLPLTAIVVFVCAAIAMPQAALAHGGEDHSTTSSSGPGNSSSDDTTSKEVSEKASELAKKFAEQRAAAEQKRQEAIDKLKTARTAIQEKRDEAFKKICENRQTDFRLRLGNVADRNHNRLEVLDTISSRVQQFVKDKNLTVDNYDTLLADVQTKAQLAHSLYDSAKSQASTFACGDGQDAAKASFQNFKDVWQQESDALKDYKTALKNLITAVKSATAAQKTSGEQ